LSELSLSSLSGKSRSSQPFPHLSSRFFKCAFKPTLIPLHPTAPHGILCSNGFEFWRGHSFPCLYHSTPSPIFLFSLLERPSRWVRCYTQLPPPFWMSLPSALSPSECPSSLFWLLFFRVICRLPPLPSLATDYPLSVDASTMARTFLCRLFFHSFPSPHVTKR